MTKSELPSIVILTGAGISAESGIPTFRASDGLWENHRITDVASPEGFQLNPALVNVFYNDRRKALLDPSVSPNQAHESIARLQREYKGSVYLVTQNIDDLHDRVGADVWHMHGELLKVRCTESNSVIDWRTDVLDDTRCSCCTKPAPLRPHVVWFGEEPLYMDKITHALSSADIFAAIGTSGHVYPAAGFVQLASEQGARTIEFNLEPSEVTSNFDDRVIGPASKTVPQWVDDLLA